MPPRPRYALAPDGTRIAWTSTGSGAPAVLLTDGIGCAGFIWSRLRPELARGRRVLHWNYRGHGASGSPTDPERSTVDDCVGDLLAVLDAAGEDRAVLAGHSMGVQIVLEAHRRAPARVAALLLVCGAPGRVLDTFHDTDILHRALPWVRAAVDRWPTLARSAFRALVTADVAMDYALAFEVNRALLQQEDLAPYFRDLSRVDPALFVRLLASASEHDATDHLPEIRVPTLVVAGVRDGFTPLHLSTRMHEAIPGSELLVLPGGTHVGPLEHPALLAERVTDFLARHAPATPPARPRAARASAEGARAEGAASAGTPRPCRREARARPAGIAVSARGLAAAALVALAALARAQPYDPSFRWRTIDTAHFRIHHHQGEEALAQDVAREAERAFAELTPKLGYAPAGRTEIVLSDDVDDANGSATPVPYNTIRLYAVPPVSSSVLQDYRDWLREVVQHEYVHILHLDHVGGVPAAFDAVFGKLWVPNGFLPLLFIEGLAVTNESAGDPASGRNASALFDMYARAVALEGPFPRLDQAANPYLDWPVGNVPYLLGGRFLGFLQARYGAASLAGFAADQGAAVWPWAPSWTGARWFGGKDFPELWGEYAQAERAYALGRQAWVHTRPVTTPARLTRRGGLAETPRFSPDGRFIAYQSRTLDDTPGLRRVALDGKDLGRVTVVDSNGTLALRSPREAVVAIGEVSHEFRVYDDLWLVDVESGARRRLTRDARASDPDVSADGRTVVYVRHTGGGNMALVRRALDGGPEEVLYAHGGAQVFMPRLSRDGRVAFELHEGGRRDIAVWQDGRVERVTDDDALDTGPAWTPDGRFLLFASDRGGIFNLYAWESATGAVRQVTNVELGALEPDVSPDGKTIAFLTYSRAGYDVATLPLDEATWMEPLSAPPLPVQAPEPAAAELPSRPYSPWPTVRPTFWLPFWAKDGAGNVFGALTGGTDVLLHHIWTLQAWWSASGREPGYAAFYQGTWSWPRLDLSSSLSLDGSPGPPYRLQRVWTYADAGLTFTWTRLARALTLRTGWSGTRYQSVESADAALVPERLRFQDGFLSEASADLRYTDARRFVHSISPEEGRSASLLLRLADPAIGSDYTVSRGRVTLAQYQRVPFTRHAVVALRLAGGLAHGSLGLNAPFSLGGLTQLDVASLVPGTIVIGADQLRGYPGSALEGTGFVLGNLELRFPLGAPLLGRSTWPVFLRRVHGALFTDAGDAFDRPGELHFAGHPFAWREVRVAAGAELRLEIVLAYELMTDLRIGVAQPFGAVLGSGRAADRALGLDDATTFYIVLGPSF